MERFISEPDEYDAFYLPVQQTTAEGTTSIIEEDNVKRAWVCRAQRMVSVCNSA